MLGGAALDGCTCCLASGADGQGEYGCCKLLNPAVLVGPVGNLLLPALMIAGSML